VVALGRTDERINVVYRDDHWQRLERLRAQAEGIMDALTSRRIRSAIHGSVVRGDVHRGSDVDVVIPYPVSSHSVELALDLAGYSIASRRIAQATPGHTPKAHVVLDALGRLSVTFPLLPLRSLELGFYRFGGYLELDGVRAGTRVPGCDKQLTLISPTRVGHEASPVVGYEGEVAKQVGVDVAVVRERVRVLTRRRKVGRTGVFLSVHLAADETFEAVLERVSATNPGVRRRRNVG
jgi:predicted nucleotidyltransferase